MDFRAPQIAGTFLFHCHILEHEDAGMMGSVSVVKAQQRRN
jgi:FtsP/CotA-like multicopper oxidase with cupredoxin domain